MSVGVGFDFGVGVGVASSRLLVFSSALSLLLSLLFTCSLSAL